MPTDPRDPTPRSARRHRGDPAADRAASPSRGDDFWGGAAEWTDAPAARRPSPDTESGGRLGHWWKSLTGAGSTATRSHGGSRPESAPLDPTPAVGIDPFLDPDIDPTIARERARRRDVTTVVGTSAASADLHDHAAWNVDDWDDDGWDLEPTPPPRSGVDPLLARFGLLAIVVTLSVPVVLGLTSGDDTDQIRETAASIAVTDAATDPSTIAVESSAAATVPVTIAPTSSAAGTAAPSTDAVDSATTAVAAPPSSTEAAPAATQVDAMLTAAEPAAACGAEYELAAGDYWIRIADAAGVRLADLLAVNDATVDTVLVPGRSICLPVGAATPAPPPAPTTAAPTTTARPTTTAPVTTAAPTTAPPTTAAPTTTAKPPAPAAPAEVEAIIRSVWPDELEDRALQIAWRESNYQSNAKNYCCYGLFQIYWSVHQSWLRGIGVTSAEQLYDPMTNTQAAYALYQRSGGFGPWGG